MPTDPPTPPVLSLQEKLDRIAHEREVLALQRELARDGLREGDPVQQRDGGAIGRLLIARDRSPPRLFVRHDDGTCSDYTPAGWSRGCETGQPPSAMQTTSPHGTIAACTQAKLAPES